MPAHTVTCRLTFKSNSGLVFHFWGTSWLTNSCLPLLLFSLPVLYSFPVPLSLPIRSFSPSALSHLLNLPSPCHPLPFPPCSIPSHPVPLTLFSFSFPPSPLPLPHFTLHSTFLLFPAASVLPSLLLASHFLPFLFLSLPLFFLAFTPIPSIVHTFFSGTGGVSVACIAASRAVAKLCLDVFSLSYLFCKCYSCCRFQPYDCIIIRFVQ